MKKIGIFLLGLGLLITVFTGFNFSTRETVVDIGKLEITNHKDHGVIWSPWLGAAMMLVGGALLAFGGKSIKV